VNSPVTFSPDGQQLAFVRADDETNQTSLVVASADGQNERTLVTRPASERFSTEGLSWSPGGQTIAAAARADGKGEEIVAVSVADGGVSKIGDREWGVVGNFAWLPDASGLLMIAQETPFNAAAGNSGWSLTRRAPRANSPAMSTSIRPLF
jgi:Tol biopolymer transport system component